MTFSETVVGRVVLAMEEVGQIGRHSIANLQVNGCAARDSNPEPAD